jgi:hypothetical protein
MTETTETNTDVLALARQLTSQGYAITPVAYGTKKPILTDWPNIRISLDELPMYFGNELINFGVLLGESSGGLVDVDLDCDEAVGLAKQFLPSTDAVFGHESKRRSHYLYFSNTPTKKFIDASTGETILELRSTGQTVFPKSMHPSGEVVEWDANGQPSKVQSDALLKSVKRLAVATLLARHWPKGSRHTVSLALAGALLKNDWQQGEVTSFISEVCEAAKDEEISSRIRSVRDTAETLQRGEKATGFPTLREYFDQRIANDIGEWLEIAVEPSREHSDSLDSTASKRQAERLVELAEEAELFHTQERDCYASIPVDQHTECWQLNSQAFEDWLNRKFYLSEHSIPTSKAFGDAVRMLRGKARYEGKQYEVHMRLAEYNGEIFLDLCDDEWRVVRISKTGWAIVKDCPIRFRRAGGMRALPVPAQPGDINLLKNFVNVSDEDWPLLVSWLVASFRPGKPFPILLLHGEQGSAKSTTSRMLRSLIDPNGAAIRPVPVSGRDLMITAKNSWIIALDNISFVPDWLSDNLCRLSTGGGFATRELYTNSDEMIFEAMRPILVNGIEEVATRSDLLDRTLSLNLPIITEKNRRDERTVWSDFEKSRASILGGLCTAVSGALKNVDAIKLSPLPRMADFAIWATAAETELGLTAGTFMKAYNRNRDQMNDLAIESSPIAAAIINLINRVGSWKGTATGLLRKLESEVDELTRRQQNWPKSAKALGGAIRRIATNLRSRGIDCTKGRDKDKNGTRLIHLKKITPPSSDLSDCQMKSQDGQRRDTYSGLPDDSDVSDNGCDDDEVSF